MSFAEAMAGNPPRVVVLYQRGADGAEQFQWGVVGAIPMLSLLGGIMGAQHDLCDGEWMPEPEGDGPPAFVGVWDASDGMFSYWKHRDIPDAPLCGMLEAIKSQLVASRMAQHSAAQRVQILGPDGRPMRG